MEPHLVAHQLCNLLKQGDLITLEAILQGCTKILSTIPSSLDLAECSLRIKAITHIVDHKSCTF